MKLWYNDTQWVLLDKAGNPVDIGSPLVDFRGDETVLESAEVPRSENSTGRVNNYYPSVFGLEWVVT